MQVSYRHLLGLASRIQAPVKFDTAIKLGTDDTLAFFVPEGERSAYSRGEFKGMVLAETLVDQRYRLFHSGSRRDDGSRSFREIPLRPSIEKPLDTIRISTMGTTQGLGLALNNGVRLLLDTTDQGTGVYAEVMFLNGAPVIVFNSGVHSVDQRVLGLARVATTNFAKGGFAEFFLMNIAPRGISKPVNPRLFDSAEFLVPQGSEGMLLGEEVGRLRLPEVSYNLR